MPFEQEQFLKISLILKLTLLVVMLVVVVAVMRGMNEQSTSKFFAAFGIDPGSSATGIGTSAPAQALDAGQSKYNVCKTRVRAVVWPDGRKIEESREHIKARWLAVDPTPREIGSLDVEKWFSRHCEIVVREAEPTKGVAEEFQNFVTFEFIDGTKTDFARTASGILRAGGDRQFRSEEFDAAIAELVSLAQLHPVGP